MQNSAEIQYEPLDGKKEKGSALKVRITPSKRNRYKEILELCHILLVEFADCNAYPGDLLNPSNENVWGNIDKLIEYIPLVGGGKLDVARMSTEDIIRVFFTRTTTIDEDGRLAPDDENTQYLSGEIARLNGFSFFRKGGQGLFQKAVAESAAKE